MPDGTTLSRDTDGAGTVDDWRAALPEELREAATLARFDDVAALAREHVHLQSLIGRKGLIAPGADASSDERAAFYTALGRPPTPDDYDLSEVALPDDMPWNGAVEAAMLKEMHAAGLTNDQARALVAAYGDLQGAAWRQATATQDAASRKALAALEAEWGERFDARVDLANRAFRATFGDGFDDVAGLELAGGGRLGDHPALVRAFAALGERIAEPELVGGRGGARRPSPDGARDRLHALEGDPEFRAALLERSHPDHRAAVAKRSQLAGIAFGTSSDDAG
jgi:hypothetical protein